MKRVSRGPEQPIVGVPVVLEPVDVDDPPLLVVVPVRVGEVLVAVLVEQDIVQSTIFSTVF